MVRKKNVLATMAQIARGDVPGLDAVGAHRLQPRLHRRRRRRSAHLDRVLLHGMAMDSISPLAKTIPESLFMIYQMTFAIITVALVAGSVADRMRFSAFLLFCVAVAAAGLRADRALGLGRRLPRQPRACSISPAARWCISTPASPAWSPPIMLGARRGYGTENLAPYDLSLAVIGTGLLWVGWFGFNGGSALGANSRAGDGDRRHASRRQRRRAAPGWRWNGGRAASRRCSA